MFIFQEQKIQFQQGAYNFSVSKLNLMYFFQFLFTGLMMIPLDIDSYYLYHTG